MHHKASGPLPGHERVTDAAARLGDGTQLKAEDWQRLSYSERTALHQTNRAAYENLRDGRDATDNRPGWRP